MYSLSKIRKIQFAVLLSALMVSGVIFSLNKYFFKFGADEIISPGESQVENLTTNWQDYQEQGSTQQSLKIPKYDKLELTFDVNWYHNREFSNPAQKYDPIADEIMNPYWPYDPSPAANTVDHPSAVPVGKGISVDGLFSNDNWTTTITQPGFWYQDYDRQIINNKDWIYPKGRPQWKIRFAPKELGDYQYKIRITDATGQTYYTSITNIFSSIDSPNHGFVQVSKTDPRYFETSDGKNLNLVGNNGISGSIMGMESELPKDREAGVNLVRTWWQGSSTPAVFGLSGQGGYVNWSKFNNSNIAKPGELFSSKLTVNSVPWDPAKTYAKDEKIYIQRNSIYKAFTSKQNDNLNNQPSDNGSNDWWQDQTEGYQDIVPAGIAQWGNQQRYVSNDLVYIENNSLFEVYKCVVSNINISPLSSGGWNYWKKLSNGFSDSAFSGAYVSPNKKYRLSVWVKTDNVIGNGDAGFVLNPTADVGGIWSKKSSSLTGTHDWQNFTFDFTTDNPNCRYLTWLSLGLYNVVSGTAYFTDLSLKEIIIEDTVELGAEIMPMPNFEAYKNYSQYYSWIADQQIKLAKDNDVYLKIVMEEKQDIIFGNIKADGTNALLGFNAGGLDGNVYASNTHASRIYQQYYWRYLAARYSYSTAIHSFELLNEGDPFNGNHYNAIYALGDYFQKNDPNQHLTTSSFWHTYLSKLFTSPLISYGDWHKYITPSETIGWQNSGGGYGGSNGYKFWDYLKPDYQTPPGNLHIINDERLLQEPFNYTNYGGDAGIKSWSIPVVPGHTYRVKYKVKSNTRKIQLGDPSFYHYDDALGRNVGTATANMSRNVVSVLKKFSWRPGTDYVPNGYIVPFGNESNNWVGDFDWKEASYTFDATIDANNPDNNTWYVTLEPTAFFAIGDAWFDDVSLYDETNKTDVLFPNGSFDQPKMNDDTALYSYYFGTQVGFDKNRQDQKPVVIGESAIAQELQNLLPNDTDGIWYKKMVWGMTNPGGVVPLYWSLSNNDRFVDKGYGKYSRSYQNFMKDISLNNGKYQDALAQTSNQNLRAWGQKEIIDGKADKAHLWIDNAPHTWKNVIDAAAGIAQLAASVSGNITISDMQPSKTYKLEWWNTSEPDISKQILADASLPKSANSDENGNLTIHVDSLASDIALKISVSEIKIIDTPATNISRSFTYKSRYPITGTKSTDITKLSINGTDVDVPTNITTWTKEVDLPLGLTTLTIIGKDSNGNQSESITISLTRRRLADANNDNVVNIKDFSSLMSNWNKSETANTADFNEDSKVNIQDFSIMMSYWGK